MTIVEDDFDRMWSELVSHFPLKVMGASGLRMLRARDANAKTNQKAKRAYERYAGTDKTKHDHVMRCLIKNELVIVSSLALLGYMQQLQTWVNNHTWEKYDTIDNEKSTGSQSRITRKL